MQILKKITCLIFFIGAMPAWAQFNKTAIEQRLELAPKAKINETLIQIGESFIDQPYLGGTLEGPEEKLVCKVDAFDCYTFIENVLAIALTKSSKHKSYDNYIKNLLLLRYRNGEIDGYASRIHYFSEWAKIAEQRKVLSDLTPAVGTKLNKNIDFMSKNRALYPSFATDEKVYHEILAMERRLHRFQMYFISKENFKTYQPMIRNGDIIAFTSNTPGLDVNHEGFAIWKGNKLFLMHASAEKKKVVVSTETILDYLKRISKHSGIMLLRVNQPSN